MPAEDEIFVLRQETNLHRVRLSPELLKQLEWPGDDIKCLGFFRFPGELLCAAEAVKNDDGTHPFDQILRIRHRPPRTNIHSLSMVPPAGVLTAGSRIIHFTAAWTSAKRNQLDLQLGVEVTKQLGWNGPAIPPIYARAWSRLLLLLSEARLHELQRQDFTLWEPPEEPTND